MKYILFSFLCFSLLASFGQAPSWIKNSNITEVMRILNCDSTEARNFLFNIQTPIEAVQTSFTNIASRSYDKLQKPKMIDEVINSFFVSERSYVQVSPSPKTDVLRTFYVRNYLNRLKTLSETLGRDVSIIIEFLPDVEVYEMIKDPDRQNTWKCAITTWQVYRIIKEIDGQKFTQYTDITQKIFLLECYEDNGLWSFKIKGINAQPALTPKEFEKIGGFLFK